MAKDKITKSITRILLKFEFLTALNINKYYILNRGTVHGKNLQEILSLKNGFIFSFSDIYKIQGIHKDAPVRCVFSKPCTKFTLHCNHRSGHHKTEHTESVFLLRRHLGHWPRSPAVSMRSELLVAHEKLGQLLLLTV